MNLRTLLLAISIGIVCLSVHGRDVYESQRALWLEKAENSKPALKETVYRPQYLIRSISDPDVFQGWRMEKAEEMDALYKASFKEKKNVIVDFGRHITGYYSFKLTTLYRTQDAPIRMKFTFGEVPSELNTAFDPYPGTLSRAWLQDEIVTITQIEQYITIPRRISFRYVKIELLASSPDFAFAFSDMYFTATSSASGDVPELAVSASPVIREIHKVALGTLKECMQTVYEDGTKRDQRLWIGDLYLESIANIYTFKQHDLTKRCLYLLAGLAADDGRLHANVFETPEPHPQYESHCLDYSLLYNVTLLEYLKATGDMETAADLWSVVKNQVADALSYLDDDYIFNQQKKEKPIWLFFDWRSGLDTNTPIQGLMVFALNNSYELAQMLGKEHEVKDWPVIAKKMKNIARKKLYDSKKGYFISGDQKQVSYMSQIWMILSGILSPDEGRTALKNIFDLPEAVYPGAPYGYHYLIEASIKCGLNVEAKNRLIDYWGGMVKKGADTFWEVYDPNDEYLSPYNFYPMNSYCHAWSCTPVYFIHKYPELFQRD